MRKQKLRLEDLAVESFQTNATGGYGTVRGHAEAEAVVAGTLWWSWCGHSCDGSCDSCFTCDDSCWPDSCIRCPVISDEI